MPVTSIPISSLPAMALHADVLVTPAMVKSLNHRLRTNCQAGGSALQDRLSACATLLRPVVTAGFTTDSSERSFNCPENNVAYSASGLWPEATEKA